ncbi:2,3-diaminopropionate biosynthesis protein SbnA [Ferviditalea candida]|uniref:2,3-diaminopropionate biosynthesis protein SbnA n=1 Tax=Ferviditalea candida TaxID=3108399 RepID=A0ABU5ZGI7_9BACL|nr:2,3-diaminopropionate biosynthesis protein SbnA [Paenibacillaceae bacterium T2]
MEFNEGILSAVGNTPLVRLNNICTERRIQIYGKLEFLNPGGSSKDRAALEILKYAAASGAIQRGSVIVESSSGNMAISLAQICAYHGLKFICVIDAKTTEQNIRILKTYGTEIEYVAEPDPHTGEYLTARLQRVQDLLSRYGNAYWPNQYANGHNSKAHYRNTMREISEQLERVDYLFVGLSTCGTWRGCAEYVRDHGLATQIIAVDAAGSVISGPSAGERMLPGLGAGIVPPLYRREWVDRTIRVTDLDCVVGCRRLVRREAILAGGSSGGVLTALQYFKESIPDGANCVLIFPDRGERYLDTIYNDCWVEERFGSVSGLWEDGPQDASKDGFEDGSAD